MRRREREGLILSSPYYVGTYSFDQYRPYGDGPWYDFTPRYFPSSSSCPQALSEELCYDELHNGPPYHSGGPFQKWHVWTDWPSVQSIGVYYSSNKKYRYSGGFVYLSDPRSYLDYSKCEDAESADWGDVSSYGPTAWARFKPKAAKAGLGQFLGEARDIPRMLKTTALVFQKGYKSAKRGGGKKAADQWLNTQFGWMPFIRDLRNFVNLSLNYEKEVLKLQKHNNKWLKRGGVVTTESESEVVEQGEVNKLYSGAPTYVFDTVTTPRYWYSVTRSTSKVVWYTARYKYYIPGIKGDGILSKINTFRYLFGLNLTPELVWELTPWSWLIDWGSNIGDNISNMSSILSEGVVAKYAYVMGTKIQDVTCTAFNRLIDGLVSGTWTASLSRKSRVGASPFGFDLGWDDFTPFQASILTALGVRRL